MRFKAFDFPLVLILFLLLSCASVREMPQSEENLTLLDSPTEESVPEETDLLIQPLELTPRELIPAIELNRILINEILIPNIEKSDWVKKRSIIKIGGSDNNLIISIEVTPDKGRIFVSHPRSFPVKIFVDNALHDSLLIQLPDKINKFKVGLTPRDSSKNEHVFLIIEKGSSLKLKTSSILLIVPAGVEVTKHYFRRMFPKKINVQIYKK